MYNQYKYGEQNPFRCANHKMWELHNVCKLQDFKCFWLHGVFIRLLIKLHDHDLNAVLITVDELIYRRSLVKPFFFFKIWLVPMTTNQRQHNCDTSLYDVMLKKARFDSYGRVNSYSKIPLYLVNSKGRSFVPSLGSIYLIIQGI